MFFLSLLLHIYQPPTQYPAITKKITDQSYRLILNILEKTRAKITLNIPASLTEQLARLGGEDVIRGIKNLAEKGQMELTGTAAYHPLLPKLPEDLITSQITLNSQINQKYFGKIYCPDGFFPPEMAFNSKVARVLKGMGFDWVILDEFGYKRELGKMKHDVIYIKRDNNSKKSIDSYSSSPSTALGVNSARSSRPIKSGSNNKNLTVFFRNNRLSLAIAMSQVKTLSKFLELLHTVIPSDPDSVGGVEGSFSTDFGVEDSSTPPIKSGSVGMTKKDSYLILALDGETFGHHQPGQDKLLLDILSYKKFKIVTISELKKYFRKQVPIVPLISSWGATLEDLRKKIYWPKWDYPGNPIHKLQWELTKLAIFPSVIPSPALPLSVIPSPAKRGEGSFSTTSGELRKALHSDQYFWASHRPYWHPGMVERGAKMLLDTVLLNPKVSSQTKKEAQKLYNKIVMLEKKLYGDEIIT